MRLCSCHARMFCLSARHTVLTPMTIFVPTLFMASLASSRLGAFGGTVFVASPISRCAHTVMTGESDEDRRTRLERLGREEAAEFARLDSAGGGDGGLMAEFNERLDKEGGATMFKAKSALNQAGDAVKQGADGAQRAGEGVAGAVDSWIAGLTEQQRKILTIVGALIAFNLVINAIISMLR